MVKQDVTVQVRVADVEYTATVDWQSKHERPVAISASTGETWAGEWDDGLYVEGMADEPRARLEGHLFDAINAAVRRGQ